MDEQPLAIDVLEDVGPAECGHFVKAGSCDHVGLHGSGAPDDFAGGVQRSLLGLGQREGGRKQQDEKQRRLSFQAHEGSSDFERCIVA